jgi:hypothetical protein
MVFSKRSLEGELFVDHRASPGLTPAEAIALGYDPSQVRGGAQFTTRTLHCVHCGGDWVENPLRQRPRNTCFKCDAYVCDTCAAVMRAPDYVHRPLAEVAEMVTSGRFQVTGPASNPNLKPTWETENG